MPFNPLAGITGNVAIAAVDYAFSKWTVEMKCVVVKANNFTGGGYQQVVPGLVSATITLEALTYDGGNMTFAVGDYADFTLSYSAVLTLAITVMIESITGSIDVEAGQPIKITGQSHGAFTAAIA